MVHKGQGPISTNLLVDTVLCASDTLRGTFLWWQHAKTRNCPDHFWPSITTIIWKSTLILVIFHTGLTSWAQQLVSIGAVDGATDSWLLVVQYWVHKFITKIGNYCLFCLPVALLFFLASLPTLERIRLLHLPFLIGQESLEDPHPIGCNLLSIVSLSGHKNVPISHEWCDHQPIMLWYHFQVSHSVNHP
jgi:hypothetical protein